jgi:hypothetical protein
MGRFSLTGPDVSLDAGVAQNLALVLQEFTTNAIKYGSISSLVGTISINSSLGDGRCLDFTWSEQGGSLVRPPERRGFGSQLIGQAFASNSRAATSYQSEGLEARFEISLTFVRRSEDGILPAELRTERAASSLQVLSVEDEVLIALEAEAELLRAGSRPMTRAVHNQRTF